MMELQWPSRPSCHDTDPWAQSFDAPVWREPRLDADGPYAYPFRTCSYCGSIHPGDLLSALAAGAKLSESDWKYGWPHKFYVDGIHNPKVGQEQISYTSCGRLTDEMVAEGGWEPYVSHFDVNTGSPVTSYRRVSSRWPAPVYVPAKWYNTHLNDLDEDAFLALTAIIGHQTRVQFSRRDGRLQFAAR